MGYLKDKTKQKESKSKSKSKNKNKNKTKVCKAGKLENDKIWDVFDRSQIIVGTLEDLQRKLLVTLNTIKSKTQL